jgi:PTH1 family peptidyl-tRNA hydrolase
LWLVVGLGNPGEEYAATRHNAGFRLVQRVARARGVELRGRAFKARTAVVHGVGEDDVMLALPQTFMNRSGIAVREILSKKGIPPERMVVVYDDLDIPLGEIRVRKRGSPGTHKGMVSIVDALRTREFPRLRIGIGPLPEGREAADYVLAPFGREERPLFERSLNEAAEALGMILAGGGDRAMARFNRRTAVS